MINKVEIILETLHKISDLTFQEDVWINQKYWDKRLNFGEAVNTLDDYDFFDEIETGKIKLQELKDQVILDQFIKALLAYQEPSNSIKMLEDPKWEQITIQAKEVYNLLREKTW